MARWEKLSETDAAATWDQALLRFPDYTPFQSFAWGEFRKALGWESHYWLAYNEAGEIVAMLLGHVRRYPLGFGLVWSEGGPIGDLTACDESLMEAIKGTTKLRRIYFRFRCDRPRHIEDCLHLSAVGWNRSWSNLTSNYTMTLDLNRDEKSVLASCDRNWRRNLRRADEANLSSLEWLNPAVSDVQATYLSMQTAKGLGEQRSTTEIENLLKLFKRDLILYRCEDDKGTLLSLLGWIVLGNKAWAVLWATNEAGRKLNASHSVFWALTQHCLKLGVQGCDLAGIDPVKNHGVYRFKRDTGATPLEYLGEWDRATEPWLRWVGNWGISRRGRIKQAEAALSKRFRDSGAAAKDTEAISDARTPAAQRA